MKSVYHLPLLFIVVFSLGWSSSSADSHEDFLDCLSSYHPQESSLISRVIYTERNSSYSAILESSIHNLRFSAPNTPKPLVIVTPLNISHVQATIHCSKTHGLQIRTRSGGHDFEGLSYVSEVPFVVVDLVHFRSIDIDVENEEAWVQSGAITGELYYRINERTTNLTFPGALCHTVGIGGFISGGGYGLLFRKYGLAGDNVLDAQLVDANGRVLDRRSMGEDLFWAIRGGGGGSFGIILSWKVTLVPIPSTVTVFSVGRTLEQNATELLHRWQYVAPNLPNDVYSVVSISTVNGTETGRRTVLATFTSVFQGSANELMALMQERFPELGLVQDNFVETTWIGSLMFVSQLPNETSEILLDRTYRSTLLSPAFKAKSDYVRKPMPEIALQGLWSQLLEDVATTATMNIISYGGKMDEFPESALPFPHRKGTLYKIDYNIGWQEEENNNPQRYINWIRKLYTYMAPFVSKSPREAYVNYRDLDIGRNDEDGKTSYKQASVWGRKYFKRNFDRLVYVKSKIDPENFFRHEQSIPPRFH
ncbi:FAD-binding Berberine family protein [Hibiscus syriacus]|uniref:FAD-binding Berberine family protein n=1 Tax=Hibiscus syriacus TaxID=106335 RepID=A0A6A3B9B7_HIBSY|nr:berberine bridge enzyme-like 8 [Hibiscus syriacus]KAE8712288.1 FAD-binding Berberine family protein [Hibiscus syriacus]